MKIIIFSPTSTEFKLREDQPLGGADSCLLKMIETLSVKHDVHAYIPVNEKQMCGEGTIYPYMDLFEKMQECDLLIFYRKIWAIPNTVDYKKIIFYSQDSVETPCYSGIKDKSVFKIFDRVILLSEFHKQNFLSSFNYPNEKISIIGNAADELIQIPKEPLTFIYFSTPYRVLVVLMKMWKKIIEKYPAARLHVYSSMSIYGASILDQTNFKPMFDGLERMKGVTSHGSVSKYELTNQLRKTFMLLYPNTYPETFCNVLMEARAARTPFITSDLGALKETGGLGGLYVKGSAYSEEYQTDFLAKLEYVLQDKVLYECMQKNCYPIRTWEDYSKDLLREITKD